jgi:hypothetical protein
MINKIEIEEYLMMNTKIGYVYFIYSDITKMVYVGETTTMTRINIYQKLIENPNISSYNYYTKGNTINYELAGDIVDPTNQFKILFIETRYHKHLEKTYIKHLCDKKDYTLYNKKLYTKHKCDFDNEIDFDIISKLPKNKYKNLYRELFDRSVMALGEDIYMGEGIYLTQDNDFIYKDDFNHN